MRKCADIAGAAERLQCFDAAVAAANTPSSPKSSVAETETEDEGGVLSWFGLSKSKPTTKPEDFGKPPEPVREGPKEITEISAGVIELARSAHGRAIFILDNGQVWKQIDGDETRVPQLPESKPIRVTIEKALLGSYALTVEGRSFMVKVRRLK